MDSALTPRDRILAALSPGGTSDFAAVIPYEGIYFRDRWFELSPRPWWHLHSPDIEQQLGWRRDAAQALGQDWFAVGPSTSAEDREALSIEERPEGVFCVDRRTGEERRLEEPRVSGIPDSSEPLTIQPPALPSTVEEVDACIRPPDAALPDRIIREGRDELARRCLQDFGAELFPISHVSSPLWTCYDRWGFEGMMLLLMDSPEVVLRACERNLEHQLVGVQVARAVGAQGIWIEECMLDMIRPDDYRTFNLPFVRRLTEAIRQAGMFSIHYFCGNPGRHWDCLLDTGADALALEEGKKGFEIPIEQVVERIGGRMCVLGNLDSIGVLQDGTDEDLEREIRRQLAAGRANRGRFIMSLGSPVTPGTPVSRVRRYCDLVHSIRI